MDADVAVIGGGPVGSTMALLLARAGRRVTVLEKGRLPRDKPCGEGLLPSGVRVLAGVGVDLAAEGFPPIAGVRYRLEGGPSVRGDLRSGPGRGVRRLRLDALLADRAAAAPGVSFLCGCEALVGHLAAGGGAIRDEIVVTLLDEVEVYAAPAGPGEVLVAILGQRGALRRPSLTV